MLSYIPASKRAFSTLRFRFKKAGNTLPTFLLTYDAFFRAFGERPSPDAVFDRFDRNLPYTLDNCGWRIRVRAPSQGLNLGEGMTKTDQLSFEAAQANISMRTLQRRLAQGMTLAEAKSHKPKAGRKPSPQADLRPSLEAPIGQLVYAAEQALAAYKQALRNLHTACSSLSLADGICSIPGYVKPQSQPKKAQKAPKTPKEPKSTKPVEHHPRLSESELFDQQLKQEKLAGQQHLLGGKDTLNF